MVNKTGAIAQEDPLSDTQFNMIHTALIDPEYLNKSSENNQKYTFKPDKLVREVKYMDQKMCLCRW